MAKKKTLKKKSSASSTKKAAPKAGLAESLVGSANEIWLAGLGAFAKAQSEGKKIYDKLIDEGKDFEKLFKSVPQKAVKEVKSTVDTAKKRASESWDKLEDVFEKRVEKSLRSLGVPTSKELKKLSDRIESLTSEVENLAGQSAASKPAKASKTVKKAAKKATKKAAKKVAKKTTKKTAKKSVAKKAPAAATKTTKKTTKKATKKVAKKTTKKTS
ncbi:phasin family protein [Marinicella sp. W31]|uniref:phasin family protein n=1 Tax=Marinicella sp. W31 TaxID=3023713 RepID=UPI0037584BF9